MSVDLYDDVDDVWFDEGLPVLRVGVEACTLSWGVSESRQEYDWDLTSLRRRRIKCLSFSFQVSLIH